MLKNFGLVVLVMVGFVIAGCGGGSAKKTDPLEAAIHSDNAAKAVRLVKSRGMSVDRHYEGHGTLLGHAAQHSSCSVLEALLNLDADANVDAMDSEGRTPLMLAAFQETNEGASVRCIQILLRHGADIERMVSGGTPLHWAAWMDNVGGVRALLEHGADVEATTDEGDKALHVAARQGSAGSIRALLAHGVDPNMRDVIDGNTALHLVKSSERGVIAALIEAGADRNLRNNRGVTTWQAREELQEAADETEAEEARQAEARAQQEREDWIRREERWERDQRARERQNQKYIDRQLCLLDPNCAATFQY